MAGIMEIMLMLILQAQGRFKGRNDFGQLHCQQQHSLWKQQLHLPDLTKLDDATASEADPW